jgi:hypothetical protein
VSVSSARQDVSGVEEWDIHDEQSSGPKITEQEFFDREWRHERFLDSITYQSIDEWDERGLDVMFRSTDFFQPREVPDTDYRLPYNRAKPFETVSDVDLGMADLDEKVSAAYEVKPNPEEADAGLEQLEKFADRFRDVMPEDYALTGHEVTERHVNTGYLNPPNFEDGLYLSTDALEKLEESPEYLELISDVLRGFESMDVFFVEDNTVRETPYTVQDFLDVSAADYFDF